MNLFWQMLSSLTKFHTIGKKEKRKNGTDKKTISRSMEYHPL
jgi:hypothetical protein